MSTAQRTCSICHQPGHNKRTCPQATGRNVALATKVHTNPPPVTQPIEATDCPICMEPLGNTNCCTTPCGHQFCLECFVTHTKTKSNCPVCRADIPGAGRTQRSAPQRSAPQRSAPQPARPLNLADYPSMRAAAQANRFDVYIQNHSDTTLDVWWIRWPSLSRSVQQPLPIQYNIRPGTVRRLNVGASGDRFTLAEHARGYQPLVEFQANTPNINFVYTGTTLVELD